MMAQLRPIDYDPFAPATVGPRLTPVEEDPFAEQGTTQGVARFASPAIGAADPTPYAGFGDAATGAAKALGAGLVRGAVGLGTLPGNLESLVRAGANRAAGLVGVEPPVSPENLNPVTFDNLMTRLESRFGKLPEPQTTAEKYIRAVGEFAPAAIGGGASLGAKAAQVVAPALASEAAGQATEGTSLEPWARVGGALAGGTAANLGARVVTPAPADPVRLSQVKELERQGVKSITAGQRTGNERLKWVEDATTKFPGGGRMRQVNERAAEEFTAAALSKAGIQGQTRATPEVLNKAFDDLGQQYGQVGKVARVVGDRGFAARLDDTVRRYNQTTSESARIPLVGDVANEIKRLSAPPGGMTGEQYLSFRSFLRKEQRAARNDPKTHDALNRLVEQLDVQVIRNAPKNIRPEVAKFMKDLNEKYRNLKVLEDAAGGAGEAAAQGLISPAKLRQAVEKNSPKAYARGRGELSKLARSGEGVIKPLPSSGTAERGLAQEIVKSPSTVYSGIAGLVGTGSIEGAVLSGLAPWAINAMTSRGLSNPTVQRYLSNQVLPGRVGAEGGRSMVNALSPSILTRDEYGPQEDPALLEYLRLTNGL